MAVVTWTKAVQEKDHRQKVTVFVLGGRPAPRHEQMKSLTVRPFHVIVEAWAISNDVTCRHPKALWHFLNRNNRGVVTGKCELSGPSTQDASAT
jgi:hypothetical protein